MTVNLVMKWKWAGHITRIKDDLYTKAMKVRYPREYRRGKGNISEVFET